MEITNRTGVVNNNNICFRIYWLEWFDSRVVSMLDSSAEGLGSNRSRDAVG